MKFRGLELLTDIVKTSSEEQLKMLLDSYVIIIEKLDVARITFQITDYGVNIWRKDDRTPMSIVDRTLMQYYEKAIEHITNIAQISNVPKDMKFGCYYFTDSAVKLGGYTRYPKNNLVLTDIRMTDDDGIERVYDDAKSLKKWAEELRVEPMPIIYQGTLKDSIKSKIIEISRMDKKEMDEITGGSFSSYLIKLLNPWAGSTFLRNEGDFNCNAVIFKFKTDDGKVTTAKIMDDVFNARAEINISPSENRIPSDLYSIALMDICAFISENGIQKYELEERTTDFRYLEFICLLFNDFIEHNKERYRGVDFSEPEFMRPDEFKMNIDFISNAETKSLIKQDRAFEQLFKILLAGLRKKRRRVYGLFNKRMIAEINMIIDAVREKVQPPITEGLMDFSTFRVFKDDQSSPIEYEYESKPSDAPQKCKIFIIKRQFYTKGIDDILHRECLGDRVLCVLFPEKDKLSIPFEMVQSQAESAISTLPKGVAIAVVRNNEELMEIISDEKEEFDVVEILCEPCDMEWVQSNLWTPSCLPWAKIRDIGYLESEERCLHLLMTDDFSEFKKMCPSCATKFFIDMKSCVENGNTVV